MQLTSNPPSQTKTRFSPGFRDYAIGISIWMVLVSCCGFTYMQPLLPDGLDTGPYALAQQLGYIITYFACAIFEWRWGPLRSSRLVAIGVGTFVTALVIVASVPYIEAPEELLVAGGALLGVGITLGYMSWIHLTVTRPLYEIERLVLIASAASIASGFVFCFASAPIRMVLAAFLVPLNAVLTVRRLGDPKASPDVQRPSSHEHVQGRAIFSSLATPTMCCILLVLVAPIVSTAYVDAYGQHILRVLLAEAGNFAALAVFTLCYLVLKKRIGVTEVYLFMIPALATSLLVSSFLDTDQRWFVLFIADACYCAVSILMLLVVCNVSRQLDISTFITYGVMGGLVYLARLPETLLAFFPVSPFTSFPVLAITSLLVYLLIIPVFVLAVQGRRKQTGQGARQDAAQDGDSANSPTHDMHARCKLIADQSGLPARYIPVLELLAAGNSASYIATTLGLSENTVGTYRRSIYATLDVHSKQELINLISATHPGDTTSQDGL